MTAVDVSTAEYWPDVVEAPRSPGRAAVAGWVVRRAMHHMPAQVRLPDGSTLGRGGSDDPALQVHSDRFFHRLGVDLRIGLGESYMAGEWDPAPGTDLGELLAVFSQRLPLLVPKVLRRFRRLVELSQPDAERNTRDGARSNISRHYDLSNDLFGLFLDETMTYSSALFTSEDDVDLAAAQRRKIDRLLDVAHVGPGTRLLEIGTGWGQLAVQAAQRGADVHTITLSAEQQSLARCRVADAGLTDRVTVELRDYRDVHDTYDAVVSVEMIEAVGERFLPEYLGCVAKALRPGGRFALQSITMPHWRMVETRNAYGWIHKYVFPGGFIPSIEQIEQMSRVAGLAIDTDRLSLQADYAQTLRLWRQQFIARSDEVHDIGFDQVFCRLWQFYLAFSEAGFRGNQLDVWQFAMTRQGN